MKFSGGGGASEERDVPAAYGKAYADSGNRPLSQEVLAAKKPHLMEPSVFT